MRNASTSPAHTAGPRIVSTSSNAHVYDGEKHFVILSHPEESTARIIADLETLPEAEANACLIAVAPELLDTLKMVYRIACDCNAFDDDQYGSEVAHMMELLP